MGIVPGFHSLRNKIITAGIRGCVPVSILLLCKCWWQLAHEMERVLLMSSEVLVHGHTGSVVSPQSTAACGRGEWTDSRSQSPLHLAQSSVHQLWMGVSVVKVVGVVCLSLQTLILPLPAAGDPLWRTKVTQNISLASRLPQPEPKRSGLPGMSQD